METKKMDIIALGFSLWKDVIILNIGKILVEQIIELEGKRHRVEGSLLPSDVEKINGVISSFCISLKGIPKVYESMFEGKMLEASGEYFKSQALELLESCSVTQYLQEVMRMLDKKYITAHQAMHFHTSTIEQLQNECEARMITDQIPFLYSYCKDMSNKDKLDYLSYLYTLLEPITDGLKKLSKILLEQIESEVKELVMKLKGEKVRKMLICKTR